MSRTAPSTTTPAKPLRRAAPESSSPIMAASARPPAAITITWPGMATAMAWWTGP